jgi:transcriptional regulator with XRE-family HTH domain
MMTETRKESIGMRVKHLREQFPLTQAELAEKSGVAVPTIKDIERGKTQQPHPRTVRALASILQVEASYLQSGDVGLDKESPVTP